MKKSTKRKKEYQKVLELRSKGTTYEKIVSITGIPYSTVRRVCKNGIPKEAHSRWSFEENQYLLKMSGQHSENLQYCFALIAKELGRSVNSVARHYYLAVRPKVMNLDNCSFMLVDNTKINPQTKRVFEVKSNPIPLKKGMFQKIKMFIKTLINGK